LRWPEGVVAAEPVVGVVPLGALAATGLALPPHPARRNATAAVAPSRATPEVTVLLWIIAS
jgi:hypothetical protein